jgi:hypothetical protein
MMFHLVSSILCSQCTSIVSWEHCDSKTAQVSCDEKGLGKCMWVTLNMTEGDQLTMRYGRGCAKMCDVKKNPVCNNPSMTCTITCCQGDNCNGYPMPPIMPKVPQIIPITTMESTSHAATIICNRNVLRFRLYFFSVFIIFYNSCIH